MRTFIFRDEIFRSTMLQDLFSAIASLHIESDMARKIDIKQLIDEFEVCTVISQAHSTCLNGYDNIHV